MAKEVSKSAIVLALVASTVVKAEDTNFEDSVGYLHGMISAGSNICNGYPTPHADTLSIHFRESIRKNEDLNQDILLASYQRGLARTDEHYSKIVNKATEIKRLCQSIESLSVEHVYNSIE